MTPTQAAALLQSQGMTRMEAIDKIAEITHVKRLAVFNWLSGRHEIDPARAELLTIKLEKQQ